MDTFAEWTDEQLVCEVDKMFYDDMFQHFKESNLFTTTYYVRKDMNRFPETTIFTQYKHLCQTL